AEAESELVAGFHTEYSGFRWLLFFMAEYGSMFAISGIAVGLFLGGWHTGLLPWELSQTFLGPIFGNVINGLVFVLKCWIGIFIMMWVRWTLPRLRIDQVMLTCLKYLLPISFVLLLGIGFWELAVPYLTFHISGNYYFSLAAIWKYGIAAVSVAALVMTGLKIWRTPSQAPPGGTGWASHAPKMPDETVKM